MKIAHVVCTYPPYYGGMGNVAFQMAQGLIDRGHDVTTFTPKYNDVQSHEMTSHAERLTPRMRYGNAAFIPSLYKRLNDFELVHLHYPFYGVAAGIERWKRFHRGVPLVITYHMDARADGLKGIVMKWYANFFMPRILKRADAVTVSSFDYAASSEAAHVFAKESQKWHEIPFGVDVERFNPAKAFSHLHHDLQIPTHHRVLLFVGGMDQAHYFKGVSVLLSALTQLEDVTTILIGDGDLRGKYELEAAQRGVGERTRFLGYVSDEDLPRYYASVDATILPSIHSGEAFGMVLLESMASGTPVVASDLPGVRTVAANNGIVVPPGDVKHLADAINAIFAKDISKETIRNDVKRMYTWDTVVDRLEDVYQSLV